MGNLQFKNCFDKWVGLPSGHFGVVHSRDPIPFLEPPSWHKLTPFVFTTVLEAMRPIGTAITSPSAILRTQVVTRNTKPGGETRSMFLDLPDFASGILGMPI